MLAKCFHYKASNLARRQFLDFQAKPGGANIIANRRPRGGDDSQPASMRFLSGFTVSAKVEMNVIDQYYNRWKQIVPKCCKSAFASLYIFTGSRPQNEVLRYFLLHLFCRNVNGIKG